MPILRASLGLAGDLGDGLSVGAAVTLLAAGLEQQFLPNTSVAGPPFFGTRLDGARALGPGLKLGVKKSFGPDLTLGAAYTLPSRMDFEDGRLMVNMSAVGLGPVTYRQVSLSGMKMPEEFGVGLALRPSPGWELALELNHLTWSDAMRSATLTASNPDHPLAPPTLSQTSVTNWRDQTVVALGLAVNLNDRTRLLAGINHGRNPIPPENLNPLLASINETHITLGLHRVEKEGWDWFGGVEWALPNTVTYTNPALPFGPDAQARSAYLAFHFMASRRWR
jgi:long-subunit fatty acid transport protein